jgi:hypothetical protein
MGVQVRGSGWFLAWAAVGALAGFGMLAILSIGFLLFVVALAGAVLLARTGRGGTGLSGVISGLGVPLLLVAYTNRSGPGTVCTRIAGGESCAEEWAPLPWLAVGIVLVVAGLVIHALHSGRRASTT